ncbi:MAG: Ig-like domain-containing protein [Plesiomonas sp.]|uniref:Ig-like domain-containing protein n=1 Tax=Plesiomonas sp. TaxID=2486279 RepID=UPI003F3E0A05
MAKLKYLLMSAFMLMLGGCGGEDNGAPSQPDLVVITELQVTPQNAHIPVGLELQLVAQALMSNGDVVEVTTHPAITWRSSDSGIASVDDKGLVKGVNIGNTTITASGHNDRGQYFEATTAINVTDATVVGLQITPPVADIAAGLTQDFVATAIFSDNSTLDVTHFAELTWSSSNESIATISNDLESKGIATGITPGVVSITASGRANGKPFSATAQLTVSNKVITGLRISPDLGSTPVGIDYKFSAFAIFSDGSMFDVTTQPALTWRSDNTAIATIDASKGKQGIATGVSVGTATMSASAVLQGQTFSDTATLTVTNAVVTRLAVTPNIASVPARLTVFFTATAFFSDGTSKDVTNNAALSWHSLNTAVATVNSIPGSKGVATAVRAGEAIITASGTYHGKLFSADATLTVTNAVVTRLDITPLKASVAKGNSLPFTVIATLNNGQQTNVTNHLALSFSSSNPNIATITTGHRNKNGIATGVTEGTVTIRAQGWDGLARFEGSAELTVTKAEIVALSVTPSNLDVPRGLTEHFEAIAIMSDGTTDLNVTNSTHISWSSDNKDIATVVSDQPNNNGLATGISAGSVNITATVKESLVNGSAKMNVLNTSLSQIFGERHDNDKTRNYLLGSSNSLVFHCGAIVDAVGTPELGITGGTGGNRHVVSGLNVSSIEVSWGVYRQAPGDGNDITLSQIILRYSDGTPTFTCGNKSGVGGSEVSNVRTDSWSIPVGEKFYGVSIYAGGYSHELRAISVTK